MPEAIERDDLRLLARRFQTSVLLTLDLDTYVQSVNAESEQTETVFPIWYMAHVQIGGVRFRRLRPVHHRDIFARVIGLPKH